MAYIKERGNNNYFVRVSCGILDNGRPFQKSRLFRPSRVNLPASKVRKELDAFVKALRQIYSEKLGRTLPDLLNYAVTIPPGGRTDALVQTVITWQQGTNIFRTRALDADQTQAAINATFKMLNLIERKQA